MNDEGWLRWYGNKELEALIPSYSRSVPVDPVAERVKLLEQRIEQLEKTVERMDKLLSAINHRTSGSVRFGH
jgi:hypothetical protein